MGSTQYGNFEAFCRDSTLPVCNPGWAVARVQAGWNPAVGGRNLGNLGSILLSGIAIAVATFLVLRSERKKAAVGRSYIVVSICEIFTIGEFPLSSTVRVAFTGIHIGFIIATTWILMLNAVVGYQILDDGTPASLGLIIGSAVVLLIGVGYITLDTGFKWTGYWNDSYATPNRNIALYTLYQVVPLVFVVAFFVLESILVLQVLGEKRPMLYLGGAALLFALGQIFTYVVSPYICNGTSGKIDGSMFETLFNLLAVVTVWFFWSSITEDDWPMPVVPSYP
ncbi:chitin synthase export chaperone [Cercophora scortea]|uniref:Chitin synthase export chaperone n=1 Tax=Cercophora scortea TaxID=314031 RepID=A0AAE0IAV6_9PEZI|nr:chitin synthase export chaperone [Cercophora scortea]